MGHPKLRVVVSPSTWSHTKSGSLYGTIALSAGEEFWPSEDWTDFPLVLVRWWLTALSAKTFPIYLEFMDGPYELQLVGPALDCCQVLGKDTGSGEVDLDAVLDCSGLIGELESIATAVLRNCEGGERMAHEDAARLRLLL